MFKLYHQLVFSHKVLQPVVLKFDSILSIKFICTEYLNCFFFYNIIIIPTFL